jgi:hypothetical protein
MSSFRISPLVLGFALLLNFEAEAQRKCGAAHAGAIAQVLEQLEENSSPVFHNHLYARILRGKVEADFSTLSTDTNRNIVMLMDNKGLMNLLGQSSSLSPLERIGYPRDYIRELQEAGTRFKLVLIEPRSKPLLATWDNLGVSLKEAYGSSHIVSRLFEKHREELKKNSYLQLLENSKDKEILKNLSSDQLRENSEIWEFRSFLFNELRLNELYTGDGYTKTPEGERGVAEYFVANQEISSIGDHGFFDLILP